VKKILSAFLVAVIFFGVLSLYACNVERRVAKRDISVEGNKYLNAETEDFYAGVIGNINLFEPNTDITFWLTCKSGEYHAKTCTMTMTSEQTDETEKWIISLDQADGLEHTYYGTVNASLNGVYSLSFSIDGEEKAGFEIGVVPKNKIASDDFFFGVQPYVSRIYNWAGCHVSGQDLETSAVTLMDTIEYMGINLVRDDCIPWSQMMPTANSEMNYTVQDKVVDHVTTRGIKLNWIVGTTPPWAVKEEYKTVYDPSIFWTVCPEKEYWDEFITNISERYASNENILFEIWNEPDIPNFFNGTTEEYLELLESAATIIRAENPNAYVYSGGLAFGKSETFYKPYFEKYKQLIDAGLLETVAVHNHQIFKSSGFISNMNMYFDLAGDVGLPLTGAINSESGSNDPDHKIKTENFITKMLWTRSHGFKGFVQYSFHENPTPIRDMDEWAIFDSYLQPYEGAIAYSTVIRFLGQATYIESVTDEPEKYADIYHCDGKTVITLYNQGRGYFNIPEGLEFNAYNAYGNPTETDPIRIRVRKMPIYLVFDGLLTAEDLPQE